MGHRLRRIYLNPHLEPATITGKRLKLKMHCHSSHQGLLKKEEPTQNRLQKSQIVQTTYNQGDSNLSNKKHRKLRKETRKTLEK